MSLPNDKVSSSCLIVKVASFYLKHDVLSVQSEQHTSLSSQESWPSRHSGSFLWEGVILVLSVASLSRSLLAKDRKGSPLVACLRNDRFIHSFGSINKQVIDSVTRRRQSLPSNIEKTIQQRTPRVCSQGVRHPSLRIRSRLNLVLPSLLQNFASRLNSGTKQSRHPKGNVRNIHPDSNRTPSAFSS